MALILSIESSTAICSVALAKDGVLLSSREENEGFTHAEKLTTFVQEVLTENNYQISDLDAVAVSGGPGSYTGLRIGVSTAKGLCYACDRPLIVVDTLTAMADGAIAKLALDAFYCPMIDARRMEVYSAVYQSDLSLVKETSAIVIDANFLNDITAKKIVLFGDGVEKCKSMLSDPKFVFIESYPSALHLIRLAELKFQSKQFENVSLYEPFYLKEFVAGPKK